MLFDQIRSNRRRSFGMVFIFVLVVFVVVWAVNQLLGMGPAGFVIAAIVAGVSAFVGYWKSDSIALAASHAVPADPVQYARLHNLVESLCIAAGLPKPRVYIVNDPSPNAFATGRNPQNSAIAVTTGLLDRMNRVELEGVLAHELSHIKNYDILVSTLAVTMVGVVILLCDLTLRLMWWGGGDDDNGGGNNLLGLIGLLVIIIGPIAAQLMQLAVSRGREELADVSGVGLTRYPPGLIQALEKLKDDSTVVRAHSRATAHMWIEEPIPTTKEEGRLSWLNKMFMTHPPLEERIQALREL